MGKIILGLDDEVEEETGYPRQWFKEEATVKFVTVRALINNPETVETWRHINEAYADSIDFKNDVYEHVDKMHFDEKNITERKSERDTSFPELKIR